MWYLGLSARTRQSQARAMTQPPAGQAPCRESQTTGPCSIPEGRARAHPRCLPAGAAPTPSGEHAQQDPHTPLPSGSRRAASSFSLGSCPVPQRPIAHRAWAVTSHPAPDGLGPPLSSPPAPTVPWRWPAAQPHASSQARPPSSPAGSGPTLALGQSNVP